MLSARLSANEPGLLPKEVPRFLIKPLIILCVEVVNMFSIVKYITYLTPTSPSVSHCLPSIGSKTAKFLTIIVVRRKTFQTATVNPQHEYTL